MSAGPDANPGRRTARWIAPVGLFGGLVCLLAGAPPVMWAEVLGTLGTILVSVGAVFALLDRIGVLAAVTVLRRDVEAPKPRHDLPAPELRSNNAASDCSDPAEVPAPTDRGRRPMGAGAAAPDASPSRGAARAGPADRPTASAPGPGLSGAEPSHGGGPSRVRAAAPGSEEAAGTEPVRSAEPLPAGASRDAAGPDPGVQSPEPRAPVDETAVPPLAVDEPPPQEPAGPGYLIDAWDEYRRNGDGHFSPRGLQEVLDHWGFDVDVGHGDLVGAGGAVLVVEIFGTRRFYVLPSFNKSPRAVANWFDDHSGGALTGRTQHVARVAQGRWLEPGSGTGRRFEVFERGEVA